MGTCFSNLIVIFKSVPGNCLDLRVFNAKGKISKALQPSDQPSRVAGITISEIIAYLIFFILDFLSSVPFLLIFKTGFTNPI